jgi:S1-C subfamily serine protease
MDINKEMTVERRTQTIEEAPKTTDEFFGYEAANFTNDMKLATWILDCYNGVFITKILPNGIFYVNGIPERSLVLKVNGTAVTDPGTFKTTLAAFADKKGESIELLICQPDGYNRPIFRKVIIPRE